ncbi:hypothetical protein LSCM1_02345 [Leishmania martiniquensis]|uniref:FHA domain-containing protein n=1 Tax=Leishmania martiniquensis TaxID=1580590 RepID=A0A836KEZ7_9TRYP|nr:hypothetical protein LSCM1_02345 [Leishmania martiniquensis]
MTFSVDLRTRLFLVRSGCSPSRAWCSATAVKDLSFLELPSIPVATANCADGGKRGDALPRPLVSPVVHIGRQTPFLSSALQNDRAWSRTFLEVTTWCIQGLPSTSCGGVVPVDAATLPYAGVRVRLCGSGHTIRVVPNAATSDRESTTLTERGSYTWLQHGDVLEFGTQARVRLLAVHVRVGPAAELARGASFVWVASPPTSSSTPGKAVTSADAQPRMAAVPTVLWFGRLHQWSAAPKFLKSKMLLEAEQLTLHTHEEEACRHAKAVAAVEYLNESNRKGDGHFDGKYWRGTAGRAPPSAEGEKRSSEGEALMATCRPGGGSGHRPSAAAEENEMEAATPTERAQQQEQLLPLQAASSSSSPSTDRRLMRNASALADGAPLPPTTLEGPDLHAVLSLPASSSQQQRRSHSEALLLQAALQPTRASALHRPSCGTTRCSLATFSETLDERLNDALLHLENGSHEVGDALVQRCDKAVLLLGVVEEDMSGTHGSASVELKASPSQRSGCDDGKNERRSMEGDTPGHRQRPSKRGREERLHDKGTTPSRSRRARSNASSARRVSRSDHVQCAGVTPPLQSAFNDLHPPPAQHLTRADIRRTRSKQSLQEDSQVVFFDH